MTVEKCLAAEPAAVVLGLSPATVRALCRGGFLGKAQKRRGRWAIPWSSVLAYRRRFPPRGPSSDVRDAFIRFKQLALEIAAWSTDASPMEDEDNLAAKQKEMLELYAVLREARHVEALALASQLSWNPYFQFLGAAG